MFGMRREGSMRTIVTLFVAVVVVVGSVFLEPVVEGK